MNYDGLVFDKSSGVATLRLNNPEKLNALTFQTYADLAKVMADLAHDDEVKVVLLTGTGKGFCSGGSVSDIIGPLLKMKNDELYKFTRLTCDVISNMRKLKKPIIAAVNGIAAGAGAVLMLAADLRIFSDQARAAFLCWKARGPARDHVKHESTQTQIGIAYDSVPYRDPGYYAAWAAVRAWITPRPAVIHCTPPFCSRPSWPALSR